MSGTLLSYTFHIDSIDRDGKVFQRVSRFIAASRRYGIEMVCDFNSELFKPQPDDNIEVLLTSSINDDGSIDTNAQYNPRLQSKLLDDYEYVMFGKVFKVRQPSAENDHQSEIYVSFGGLLLSLKGRAGNGLNNIDLDSQLYLLIRKAK